jgi:hypothetical protein
VGVTRLDGVLTKPFSSYRAVPVGPKGMSSPIGGGRPSVGSEALSPSVSRRSLQRGTCAPA